MKAIQTLLCAILATAPFAAQTVRNPKLDPNDLEAAKAELLSAAGAQAELVYVVRLDTVQKGSFDGLVVVYAKSTKAGKDYFAMILRAGKRHLLTVDKAGRALKPGDRFLRMGLRHEEGQPPLLRLMAAAADKVKGEQQRNLDYRFDGGEFAFVGESLMPLAS